jgi:hypothetical protein
MSYKYNSWFPSLYKLSNSLYIFYDSFSVEINLLQKQSILILMFMSNDIFPIHRTLKKME